jgi:rhodanese-related sulfurtransferase
MQKYIFMVWLFILFLPGGILADELSPQKALSVSPLEAYDILTREPARAFLIDVRIRQEYAFSHPAYAYNIPWRFAANELILDPNSQQAQYQLSQEPNPDFVGVVRSLFKPDDQLFIICDNGRQSAQASDALLEAGFSQVRQVRGGVWGRRFTSPEHPRLAEKYSAHYGQGGLLDGWVYWGLPMSHTLDPLYIYPPDLKRAHTE